MRAVAAIKACWAAGEKAFASNRRRGRSAAAPHPQRRLMLPAAGGTKAAETLAGADILLKVRRPSPDELKALKPGAIVAAIVSPFDDRAGLEALAGTGASLMAMELMPRISRAQSMDVLSSQANLAGYKAVVDAAAKFGQAIPMMMTAAG